MKSQKGLKDRDIGPDFDVLLLADNAVRTKKALVCLYAGISSHSGDHRALVICLFVCLFVRIKPETLYFDPYVWREVITPGNGCTRTQAQTTCVRRSCYVVLGISSNLKIFAPKGPPRDSSQG